MRHALVMLAVLLAGCSPVIAEIRSTETGDPDPDPTELTCDQVVADLLDEATRIRSCEEDADCGQVLVGTSCGCTHDWVARQDADAGRFYDLAALGADKQCELPFDSPCDCPAADGFACVDNQCDWKPPAPPPPPHFTDCTADMGEPVSVDRMQISREGELVVDVSHGGGCAEHEYVVCWPAQEFEVGRPPRARLEMLHLTPGDPCDGIVADEVRVDLGPMREAYSEQFDGGNAMTLVLDPLWTVYWFR